MLEGRTPGRGARETRTITRGNRTVTRGARTITRGTRTINSPPALGPEVIVVRRLVR